MGGFTWGWGSRVLGGGVRGDEDKQFQKKRNLTVPSSHQVDLTYHREPGAGRQELDGLGEAARVNEVGRCSLSRVRFGVRAADHGPTCLSKADDLIFLRRVMLQQGFPSRPTEALHRGLQGRSGHGPTRGGALAEVQLVQDTFLGQIEKQLPLALQVEGGPPAHWTWTSRFEVRHCGWSQEQKNQEQGGSHCWRRSPLKDTQPALRVCTAVASTLSGPPGTLGGLDLWLA